MHDLVEVVGDTGPSEAVRGPARVVLSQGMTLMLQHVAMAAAVVVALWAFCKISWPGEPIFRRRARAEEASASQPVAGRILHLPRSPLDRPRTKRAATVRRSISAR